MTACPTCGHIAPRLMFAIETFIAAEVASVNQTMARYRVGAHKFASKRKEKAEWSLWWKSAQWSLICGTAIGDPTTTAHVQATRKRTVTFTRHYTGRAQLMDRTNMAAGMKYALDAMVAVGLLVDDSPKWLDDHYEQIRSDRSGLHVRIEERA